MGASSGFSGFLSRLCQDFDVRFVSSRKPYCHGATRRWIRDSFGDFEVTFVSEKASISAKYLVDDNPKDALRFAAAGGTSFLLKRPWNDNEATLEQVAAYRDCHFVESFDAVLLQVSAGESSRDSTEQYRES